MKYITLVTALIVLININAQDTPIEKEALSIAQKTKDSLYIVKGIKEITPTPSLEQFHSSLTEQELEQIQQKANYLWSQSITNSEKNDIQTAKYQLSKPHLISYAITTLTYSLGTSVTLTNNSGKTVKYATFRLTSYNSVGDPIATSNKRVNGPVPNDEIQTWIIDHEGLSDITNRNNEIHSVHITQFFVNYTDLTTFTEANISKTTIDSDLERRLEKMKIRKETIRQNIIEDMYKAAATRHEAEQLKIQADIKMLKDSIEQFTKIIYTKKINELLKKKYHKIHNFTKNVNSKANAIITIAKLDEKKKKFIKILYDIDANQLRPYAEKTIKATETEKKTDTTTTQGLKLYSILNDTLINHICNTLNISEKVNQNAYKTIAFDTTALKITQDSNFITKPLRKTERYKQNRELYNQKKIDAINPIQKHISIMYVYGGSKSPLGTNLTIYPTNNIGFWAEYLTHNQIDGLTNDNPQDYTEPNEALKLFQQIKDKNLYKLEDTWDKYYQTINLGINIPFNYKKNLIIGIGIGKSITTEYRRFSVTEDFYTNSIYKQPTTNNGNFYLESEHRTSSNLNFSTNLTLILKPLTIKIGANINDRDRRDTRINIGIGLTF